MSQPPKSTMRAPSSWCSANNGVLRPTSVLQRTKMRHTPHARRLPPFCPCDLRDQAPFGGAAPLRWVDAYDPPLSRSPAERKDPRPPSAVLVPERFRAEIAPSAFRFSYRTLSGQTVSSLGM